LAPFSFWDFRLAAGGDEVIGDGKAEKAADGGGVSVENSAEVGNGERALFEEKHHAIEKNRPGATKAGFRVWPGHEGFLRWR
jgi:hypothetical protein